MALVCLGHLQLRNPSRYQETRGQYLGRAEVPRLFFPKQELKTADEDKFPSLQLREKEKDDLDLQV